ncbi:MAG TPA: ATP-binding protein [Kofleriaceae bacterium]|jgi:SpoVK/Ycf46/Vps4 family AAA+-type ATPase
MARVQPRFEFGSLPRDADRDAALVEVRDADHQRGDIVLSAELTRKLDRTIAEYRDRDMLAKHALAPRSRLLFVGPPGCGKTLAADVLAAELSLPLVYARFDGIVSSFLGETATNLRRVFSYAAKAPSLLFFDEFDTIAKRRDDDQEVGELKRVVGSFLQILDSHPRDRLVVAATNHEGLLDEALWRRFDDVLVFRRPSVAQLAELLTMKLRGVRKPGVDIQMLAADMDGFTFADAERVCREAIKTMVLGGAKELHADMLRAELEEQRARLRDVRTVTPAG